MIICDVEIEVIETWPPDFIQSAIQNRDLILSYQHEQQRIDHLCRDDVMARIHPPDNEYEISYNELSNRLDESLTQHRIVGYHCTRLAQEEIEEIKLSGLRVLSPELVQKKLDLYVEGVRPSHFASLKSNQAIREHLENQHGHRIGMTWFCPNRSTLKDSGAVYHLFKYWGGEAVYGGYENDQNTATILGNIGIPAIVKCAIPFPCAEPKYPKFAARFLSQFVANNIKHPEPSPGFDLRTKMDVPESQILEIITFSNPRFENLTGCSTWSAYYQISETI